MIAEQPCASGKSVVIEVYSMFLYTRNPEQKIIIVVPNELLASLMRLDCMKGLSSNPEKLHEAGAKGIFVCTHQTIATLSDDLLSKCILGVDELHELLKINGMDAKLCQAYLVIAFSATLGGEIGRKRLAE